MPFGHSIALSAGSRSHFQPLLFHAHARVLLIYRVIYICALLISPLLRGARAWRSGRHHGATAETDAREPMRLFTPAAASAIRAAAAADASHSLFPILHVVIRHYAARRAERCYFSACNIVVMMRFEMNTEAV